MSRSSKRANENVDDDITHDADKEDEGSNRERVNRKDKDTKKRNSDRSHRRRKNDDNEDDGSDSHDEDDGGRRRRKQSDRDRSDKKGTSSTKSRDKRGRDDNSGANESEEDLSDSSEEERRRRKRSKRRRKERKRKDEKKKRRKKRRRRDSSSSDTSSGGSSSDESDERKTVDVNNPKLLAKLQARGETLEERKRRRAARSEEKRAAFIATKFGYTAEENPFHDPNLHQLFNWKKKQEKDQEPSSAADLMKKPEETTTGTLEEIEKLRQRRTQREMQFEEMERIRREENRMKELENFDEWARKEEDFHLQQQRQRSAIRLVQGREKPIDVLAKNMLMFGGVERENRAAVKYQERYNAFQELSENLEVELEEPYKLLHLLKLAELEEVLLDIDAFLTLEREAAGTTIDANDDKDDILAYWLALKTVALDEIKFLKSGGDQGPHAKMVDEVSKIFEQGQSFGELEQMKSQIMEKIRRYREQEQGGGQGDMSSTNPLSSGGPKDSSSSEYWQLVLEQLEVHLAKKTLSEIHSQMLVRQLERLEQKREELAKLPPEEQKRPQEAPGEEPKSAPDGGDDGGFEGVEEQELVEEKEEEEEAMVRSKRYAWADKYRPRKPRYFNRVKTGYDWNKYNKAHYDRDNPPPKTVQGYKFNIFYPDLIDPSKTPKFQLLKADSDDFCIIRFTAGPPYEDVAFKIVNREWNKSRKHGFKSTFERGILSLYFNFKTNWYRR